MFVEPERSEIDELTQCAYRQAIYEVSAKDPFVLRLGAPSPELTSLYGQLGVGSSAFITAYNPLGRLASDKDNRIAQERLETALLQLGLSTLPGIGKDPCGSWPGEPSVLALGISMATACNLGQKFGQNAILWAGADAVPLLLLLR